MTMTKSEIVRDYNQSKTPLKQIGILADLNQCTKQVIVEILREAGAKLPQQFDHDRRTTKPAPQEVPPSASLFAANAIRKILDSGINHSKMLDQIEGVFAMYLEVIS